MDENPAYLQSSTLESNFVFTRAPHSPRARPVRGCDDTLKEGTTIFIIYWADYGRLRYSSEALQMYSRYMLLLGNVLQDLRIQCRSCRYRLGSQCQWIVDTGPISLSNVMRIDVRTGGPVYRIHRHTVAETSKHPSLPVAPLRIRRRRRSPHRWISDEKTLPHLLAGHLEGLSETSLLTLIHHHLLLEPRKHCLGFSRSSRHTYWSKVRSHPCS